MRCNLSTPSKFGWDRQNKTIPLCCRWLSNKCILYKIYMYYMILCVRRTVTVIMNDLSSAAQSGREADYWRTRHRPRYTIRARYQSVKPLSYCLSWRCAYWMISSESISNERECFTIARVDSSNRTESEMKEQTLERISCSNRYLEDCITAVYSDYYLFFPNKSTDMPLSGFDSNWCVDGNHELQLKIIKYVNSMCHTSAILR